MDCIYKNSRGNLCGLHAQDGTQYCRMHQAGNSPGADLKALMDATRTTKSLGGILPMRLIECPTADPRTGIVTNEHGEVLGCIVNIGPGK